MLVFCKANASYPSIRSRSPCCCLKIGTQVLPFPSYSFFFFLVIFITATSVVKHDRASPAPQRQYDMEGGFSSSSSFSYFVFIYFCTSHPCRFSKISPFPFTSTLILAILASFRRRMPRRHLQAMRTKKKKRARKE
ncbi:hypothetical protein B0I35DRAFT_229884 [Stachybotrys elegans]|uniref:Uncharacterized protein n=1 Tax=Stachybotrys elegans TaxID=80388 RepID=A0A8K0STH8_9HYPO|nr:hypothetical protein B0I35DRAFT_229884 [Stachybotrys elegans]